ncbi:MAG TPA: hypothetical protein VGG27_16260 [Magnetospirillaceae bacterium]
MSGGEDLAAWLERQGLGAGAEILRAPAALRALGAAGEDAMARAAFAEAATDLERAIEILDEMPDADERLSDAFHLRTHLAECYVVTKGHSAPATRRAFEDALNVGERLGEPVVLATVLVGLISAAAQRAEYAAAQAYADRLTALAQRSGGAFERGWALFRQGHIQFYQGDLRAARRSFENAMAVGANEPMTIGGARLSGAIMVLWPLAVALMGDIETGTRLADEHLAEAEAAGIPHNLAYVKLGAVACRLITGDAAGAEPLARTLVALCSEHQLVSFHALASIYLGWSLRRTSHSAEGIGHATSGVDTLAAIGTKGLVNWFRALLAETLFDAGEEDRALAMIEEAVKQESLSVFGVPGALRIKGDLLLRRAATQKSDAAVHSAAMAEVALKAAIQAARRGGMLIVELQAATSLARQFKTRNDSASARQVLEPIYARFKEGLDTPYLLAAKEILDSL